MEPLTYLFVVLGCLVLSAFFSSSETALLRLSQTDMDRDVREAHSPAAIAARDLVSSTSRLLVTILLGNNVVNILAASAAAAFSIHLLGESTGILVSTAVMTLLVLIFCEILPKALAAAHPKGVSYALALPLYLFHQMLRPVHLLFDRIIEPFVRWIAGGSGPGVSSAEEVLRLARLARSGGPGATPLAIIGAAAGAEERTVDEIMVPRTEIVAFGHDVTPQALLEEMLEERYTRVPIYEEDIDHVRGVVHLKDLVKLVGEDGEIGSILKPVLRVPGRKRILPLLSDMQRSFCHMALVKDEFGVTLGLVTQEDILEEIVGEIRDEFDREELHTIRKLGTESYQALGRVKVLDFNRETKWNVPARPGDTLSGLVFNTLGRAPRKGDIVRVGDYEIGVADVSGTRITRVRVDYSKLEPTPESPPRRNGQAANGH